MKMLELMSLLVFMLVVGVTKCQGVLLTAGQSVDYSFSSMSPVASGTNLWFADFGWSTGGFPNGSIISASLYETATTDKPFVALSVDAFPENQIGATDYTVGGLIGRDVPAWQDMQGAIRISVLSGSIDLDSITVGSLISGKQYATSISIPEPATCSYSFIVGIFVCSVAYRRRASPPPMRVKESTKRMVKAE